MLLSRTDLLENKKSHPEEDDFWSLLINIIDTLKENYGIINPISVGEICQSDKKKARTKIRINGVTHVILVRHFPKYTVIKLLE